MKKLLSFLLIFVLCFTLFPNTVNAAVKINHKTATVIKGDYLYLKINGTKQKVKWKSSNKLLASISKSGKVTTKGTGNVKITGTVAEKKYVCKISIIPNIDPNYKTDMDVERALAERDYKNNFSKDNVVKDDAVTKDDVKENTTDADMSANIVKMKRYGFSCSEDIDTKIGKAYLKFCEEWASEYELKNYYKISVTNNISNNNIYLINSTNNKYIIENTISPLTSGTIYTNSNIQYQYLENFECDSESYEEKQLYFSRKDLINAGIVNQ